MNLSRAQLMSLAPTKIVKQIVYVLFVLSLFSCANFKRIQPEDPLSAQNAEPRVIFAEKNIINIEPAPIKNVDPQKVIQSYQRLLNRGDPEIRKEAMHRLANVYMALSESQIDNQQQQLAYLNQAVKYYKQILDEFPDYAQSDEVKYQLAKAYSLDAKPDAALEVLDDIASLHNESTAYVESQFRRGEFYFIKKQYQVAENAYSEVIKKGNTSVFYEKALYKRGWSLFKQNLYEEALADFFELYERLAEQNRLNNDNNKLIADLLNDTQRVISLSFYNMDGAESVDNYFNSKGRRDYENKIYDTLASLYLEKERFKDAADTYFAFIDNNPLSLSSPEFNSKVIEVYQKGGFPSLILPAKEKFVVSYGRSSAFWQKYSGKVIDDLRPLLRKHLDDISTYYHAAAQKSKKPNDYLIAAKWYREILAIIPLQQSSVDSRYRFLLAECLSAAKDYENSAKEYEIIAYKNPLTKQSRDAGYRALVAYQQVKHPKNATQLEKLLPSIQSGESFAKTFASDAKAPEILARVAEQQLMINDIEAAIRSSQQLLTLPAKPTTKQINRANIIIANGLFDLKQYQKAETAINYALNSGLLSTTEKASLEERRLQAVYKLAEQAQAENNYQQAVDLFLKVKALGPKSKVAVNAHFDAATLLIELKDWKQATQLLESFRSTYPQHPLTKDIPAKLVLIHEKQQNWGRAAKEYQVLANNQKDPELAREAYWKAAELYVKAKENTQAIRAYKNYVNKYPQPYLFAQEGRYQLVQLYGQTGDQTKAHFWRDKIISFYAKNSQQNNARTNFLAAESKYLLSENLFTQYEKIKLKLPLKSSLAKKRSAMQKALDAYNAVAKYRVAQFTTASTHKIAQIYQILSRDLMSSERPKGLNEEELEEYGYLLEEQAFPFEDKAIGYFELNAKRTKEDIYDQSVKRSIQALKKLKPVQYDKTEKLEALKDVAF